MVSQKHVDAMREIADLWSRNRKREQYQRVALGEIVLSGVGQTEWERSISPTSTIPYRAMCEHLLEWNDARRRHNDLSAEVDRLRKFKRQVMDFDPKRGSIV